MRLPSRVRVRPGPLLAGLALTLSIGLTGCKGIPLKDGHYSCDPGIAGSCPDGMTCAWDPEAGEYRCFRELPADAYVPVCGNGDVDQGEQCDGQNLGGQTCEDLGHPGGTLACSAVCTFDRSGCDPPVTCGDGDIDPPVEECDGSDLGGASCETQGYDGGNLACLNNCTFDVSGCHYQECGNGTAEGDELCDDGNTSNDDSCLTACIDSTVIGQGDCCVDNVCGDGYVDPASEECDDGNNIEDDGCSNACTFAYCGDGTVEGSEVCDGADVAGQTCATLGHGGGLLTCAADCLSFDEGSCWDPDDGICEHALDENSTNSPGDCTWIQIAAGVTHSCGTKGDGTVWCWGGNATGQLGNGTTVDTAEPVGVTGITNAVLVSTGTAYSCAVDNAGAVWCWGANTIGQLGDGTNTDSLVPVQVSGLPATAATLDCGWAHACALLSDGSVWCWGAGASGQLGNGQFGSSSSPVAVTSPLGLAVDVSAGNVHSCAVQNDGTAYCWGRNNFGQLGDGTQTNSAVPRQVGTLSQTTHISAGNTHSCAINAAGFPPANNAWCWGLAPYLGNNPSQSSLTPVNVAETYQILTVGTSRNHTCATTHLSGQGYAFQCWGMNDSGQIGDGTTTTALTPAFVSTLTNPETYSAGYEHTCAIENGAAYCWGHNEDGRLGDGTLTGSPTPIEVVDPYL